VFGKERSEGRAKLEFFTTSRALAKVFLWQRAHHGGILERNASKRPGLSGERIST
jgi:hypothetical protein